MPTNKKSTVKSLLKERDDILLKIRKHETAISNLHSKLDDLRDKCSHPKNKRELREYGTFGACCVCSVCFMNLTIAGKE